MDSAKGKPMINRHNTKLNRLEKVQVRCSSTRDNATSISRLCPSSNAFHSSISKMPCRQTGQTAFSFNSQGSMQLAWKKCLQRKVLITSRSWNSVKQMLHVGRSSTSLTRFFLKCRFLMAPTNRWRRCF